jgi:hypothetical protein
MESPYVVGPILFALTAPPCAVSGIEVEFGSWFLVLVRLTSTLSASSESEPPSPLGAHLTLSAALPPPPWERDKGEGPPPNNPEPWQQTVEFQGKSDLCLTSQRARGEPPILLLNHVSLPIILHIQIQSELYWIECLILIGREQRQFYLLHFISCTFEVWCTLNFCIFLHCCTLCIKSNLIICTLWILPLNRKKGKEERRKLLGHSSNSKEDKKVVGSYVIYEGL